MFTSIGFAATNSAVKSLMIGSIIFELCGDPRRLGSHSAQCSQSLAKSVVNLEIRQKWFGQGEPPKVNRRLGIANFSYIIAHFSATSP
jgi:hypothetical protein